MKIVEFNTKNNILSQGPYSSYKDKLMKAQNGLCTICSKVITLEHFTLGSIHIHHTKPVFRKGARADVRNMQLVHS
jgi:hypothetical protein